MAELPLTQISRIGAVTVITFTPRCNHLDEVIVEAVGRDVMDIVGTANPPKLVLDLTATEFFGSSFIEVMFRAWNRLQKQPGGAMAIAGLAPYCQEVLEITHLDKLWASYATAEAAAAAINAA
jgi:anti-sigma B factor antagonist